MSREFVSYFGYIDRGGLNFGYRHSRAVAPTKRILIASATSEYRTDADRRPASMITQPDVEPPPKFLKKATFAHHGKHS